MNKESIINIHNLIISPRGFIHNLIKEHSIKQKDLLLFCLAIVSTFTMIHAFSNFRIIRNQYLIESIVYLGSYFLGISTLIVLRIYIISMIFRKVGITLNYKDVGIVIGLALIPKLILTLASLIIAIGQYNQIFEFCSLIWSLVIITIGIQILTNMNTARIVLFVIIMYGFESILKFAFLGIV